MTPDLVNDDSTTESSSSVKTVLTPVHLDGTVMKWDGNNALILPLLHEFGRWTTRTGKFQSLFAHHAASLPNGKIAVDSGVAPQSDTTSVSRCASENGEENVVFRKPSTP